MQIYIKQVNNKIKQQVARNLLTNELPQIQQLLLGWNNIVNQGMILLLERQIPLSQLDVEKINIKADGLRLMPNCNLIQLKSLNLRQKKIDSIVIDEYNL